MLLFPAVVMAGLSIGAVPNPAAEDTGRKIDLVALASVQGETVALAPATGKKAAVVVFLSFNCPVSTSYSQTLIEMAQQHPQTSFIGVCPDVDETAEHIAGQVKSFGITFPVVIDAKHEAVKAFRAAPP